MTDFDRLKLSRRAALVGLAALALHPARARAAAPRPAPLDAKSRADVARVQAYLNGITTLQSRFDQVADDGGVASGTIYHIAAVFSAPDGSGVSTCTVYVDGVALATTFTVSVTNDQKLYLAGALNGEDTTGLTFTLDEVAAYRSPLTATQIVNHYNSGSDPAKVASFPSQDAGARIRTERGVGYRMAET